MRQVPEVFPKHFITCSKSIVLEHPCGETLLLLGRPADWRKEGHTVFECGGCGGKLSLSDVVSGVYDSALRRQFGI